MSLKRITNCIWFDSNAEEAAALYTSVFPNSKIGGKQYYPKSNQHIHKKEPGSLMCVEFELDGHPYTGINGGPIFKPTPGISFQVDCKDQAEVDYYYEKLGEGGDTTLPCGWLTDKFGVSWQIIPREFAQMQREASAEQSEKMTEEMFKMKKLEIAPLKAAFNSVS